MQDAAQSDQDAFAFATPTRASHPPEAFLVQGPVHGQDREAGRFPTQKLRLDQLHASAAPTGCRPHGHADLPPRRPSFADTPVPLRLVRSYEPFRQSEQWTLYVFVFVGASRDIMD
jgi:hypothetical protein